MSNVAKVATYEWRTNRSFLFSTLCPEGLRVEASADDWADDVLRRVPDHARVFAFHLNLTQTASFPHDRAALCRALSRAGVAVLNGELTNISKALIQAVCRRLGLPTVAATAAGDPDERLIVKTNLNYGGLGERAFGVEDLRVLGWSPPPSALDAKSYKVLKRSEVAPGEWDDPTLVVERFVNNGDDLFCRVYLLGGHMVISEVVDRSLFKRMPSGIERRNWFFRLEGDGCEPAGAGSPRSARVAEQVALFVRALRVDFGALDVVLDDDGRPHIIDLNATPSWRDTVEPDVEGFLRAALDRLVAGVAPSGPGAG